MRFWVLFCRIVRAQVSDVAVYTCVASNRAGVDSKHYSLQILGMSQKQFYFASGSVALGNMPLETDFLSDL